MVRDDEDTDIYTKKGRAELIENDELDPEEEAFMQGYEQEATDSQIEDEET